MSGVQCKEILRDSVSCCFRFSITPIKLLWFVSCIWVLSPANHDITLLSSFEFAWIQMWESECKVMMMMMMNLSDIRIIFQLVFGDVGYLSVHPWTFIVPMCKISAHVQNFVAIPNKSHISTMISFQLCWLKRRKATQDWLRNNLCTSLRWTALIKGSWGYATWHQGDMYLSWAFHSPLLLQNVHKMTFLFRCSWLYKVMFNHIALWCVSVTSGIAVSITNKFSFVLL